MFDDITGDFEPYPTIFLPRWPTSKTQNANPYCSHPQKDLKDDAGLSGQKEVKGKDKVPSSRKRPRNDEDAPAVEKPAAKKFKLKKTKVDIGEGALFLVCLRFFLSFSF